MNIHNQPTDDEFDAEFCLDEAEREFVRTLARRSVDYILIGGHAVNYHGHKRCIGDMDILVDRSQENASKCIAALADMRLSLPPDIAEKLSKPSNRLRIPLHEIDILTSVEGLSFKAIYQERVLVMYEGLTLPMISRKHLLVLKQASEREQDQADYAALIRQENSGQPHGLAYSAGASGHPVTLTLLDVY